MLLHRFKKKSSETNAHCLHCVESHIFFSLFSHPRSVKRFCFLFLIPSHSINRSGSETLLNYCGYVEK